MNEKLLYWPNYKIKKRKKIIDNIICIFKGNCWDKIIPEAHNETVKYLHLLIGLDLRNINQSSPEFC